jgi:hypothetical protein
MGFGLFKASQGTGFVDRLLPGNIDGARAHGLLPGAYHFLEAGNGAAQADHFLACLGAVGGIRGLLCAVDVELQNSTTGPSLADVTAFRGRWEAKVGKGRLILYTGGWYWSGHLGNPQQHGDLPLWDSAYVPGAGDPWQIVKGVTPGYFPAFGGWSNYLLRQYSSAASIGGISPCDVSVCYDENRLRAAAGIVPTPPRPQPAPHPGPPHPTPKPGVPTRTQQIQALQGAVHAASDGAWGPDTDRRLRLLRVHTPTSELQAMLGAHADGLWGPETHRVYFAALHTVQVALRVPLTAAWDAPTDRAFLALRAACYHP